MKAKRKYVARFERDENGWWVVDVEGVQGCSTQGRTIEQGKERIREALSLYIGDVANWVEIETKVELPPPVRKAIDRSLTERHRADEEAAKAARSTEIAVRAMLDAGLSTRDAGALLGLTRQRVQQVASGR